MIPRILIIVMVVASFLVGTIFQKYVTFGRVKRYLTGDFTPINQEHAPNSAFPIEILSVSDISNLHDLEYSDSNIGVIARGVTDSPEERSELLLPLTRDRRLMPAAFLRIGDKISGISIPMEQLDSATASMAAFRDSEDYSIQTGFLREFEPRRRLPSGDSDRVSMMLSQLPFPIIAAPKTDWWFYASEEVYRPEFWKRPEASAIDVIVEFDRILSERGQHLLFITVPTSLTTYPEVATGDLSLDPSSTQRTNRHVEKFHKELQSRGMNSIDLTDHFLKNRFRRDLGEHPIYCRTDTHYNSLGAFLAAEVVAERLVHEDCQIGKIDHVRKLVWEDHEGDIKKMNSCRGLRVEIPNESVPMMNVTTLDGSSPSTSDPNAAIHIIGDSFSTVFREASFASQLSANMKQSVNVVSRRGGAMNASRRAFQENGKFNESAKYVVWILVERYLGSNVSPNVISNLGK